MVGVENDPITAAITAALYPSAQIRNEGFETTRVPENSFAATVGNVPFGGFVVHDPAHNAARHSIHNHFVNKSLALTAPGGYVAVLTSRYTMDSTSDAARRDIAERAELIGALRLPSRAWASEVTSLTPDRPRAVSKRRKVSQPASSSAVMTSMPRISR